MILFGIDEQDKSSSVIEELTQLQQRARQQDSVAERLADLQQLIRCSVYRAAAEVTQKSHALLAGEYDTLHKIVHAKTTQKPTTKREVG